MRSIVKSTKLCLRQCIPDWFEDAVVTDELVDALYNYYVDGEVSKLFDSVSEMFERIHNYCEENDHSLFTYLYCRGYIN